MSEDIVTRLTTTEEHSPSECWGCGEWGCTNAAGDSVPVLCDCAEDPDECIHDNECACDCHTWYGIVQDAKAEIERLLKYKEVADLFGAAFRMDEFGQYPPSNGDDVHRAVLAYTRLKTAETRRG